MAIVKLLFSEGNIEANTDTRKKVFMHISIIDDRVNNANRFRIGVEVEANSERNPVIVDTISVNSVNTIDCDQRTNGVILRHCDIGYLAGKAEVFNAGRLTVLVIIGCTVL